MTDTTVSGEPGPGRTAAAVYVTVEGVPDAWAVGNEIELHVTPIGGHIEAAVIVPLDQALVWAADVYAAIATAVEDTLDEHELIATLPDPGQLVYQRLAARWTHDNEAQAAAS